MKIRAFAFFIAFSFLLAAHGQSVKVFLNSQVPFQGKFQGFSTVDIFEECPPSSDTCMNWLAALKPNVIRFPSGGQAKFTHLTTGPGYGFNIDEIEEYFFNLFNCDDEDCGAGSNYEAAVNDWMLKCLAQDSLPEGQRYIDDFILMIQNLEAQLGYTIDVLFCLNIVTANAAENKAALDLLISNGIQVTGVEMGNETYGQSSGFNSFDSYLTHIQNADGLLGDQDYIGMVRQYFPEMKIGVCAAPIATIDIEQGPGITYFINPEIKRIKYDDWNIALGNTWDSSRLISSPVPYTAPLFDAAIVHFYYTSDFWSDCSVQFLEDYDTYGAACCPYTFDTPDLRLAAAFDCFSAQSKYFRDSLYKSINDYYADRLQLNNPIHINKKIWATEWNILENDKDLETTLFHNTLAQASCVFDWQNLAYQFNTSPLYNASFQEYRTMHNAASVSYRNMITAQADYEKGAPGDTTDIRKRMFYHATYLMRHIANVPVNTFNITTTLPNVKMYGYIDQVNENVYIYYNNSGVGNIDQQFNINKIKFFNVQGCHSILEYPVTHEYIQGKQLYFGSGVAYMYDINPIYSSDNKISSEIKGSKYKIYTSPKKLMIYKNSLGVIKIPISITCDEKYGNVSDVFVSAYPNPASQYIDIDVGNAENFANGYTIDLYDHTGRHIRQITASDEIYTLHRNDLPAGIYYYSVHFADGSQVGGR
ncbi:MAG: T9SS type A sorting domain-containing protein [Bacteroidetes bacterium]|nr:T9SS type A sorting domain-containing protein [Bacteroidota bacterium]